MKDYCIAVAFFLILYFSVAGIVFEARHPYISRYQAWSYLKEYFTFQKVPFEKVKEKFDK